MARYFLIYIQVLLLISFLFSCWEKPDESDEAGQSAVQLPNGYFMDIQATDTPSLLLPDFISTPMGEYNGTFNSVGSEFFYTVSNIHHDVLVRTQLQEDGSWSQPKIAPFSAPHPEFDPLFSPDGSQLYFSSHRPLYTGGPTDASNIWKVEKTDSTWDEPELVPLHGPSQGNYFSSLTSNGEIYFNIWNTGELYYATQSDTGFIVESLGDNVNSPQGDGDPFVAPDGSYLIFRSYRPGGLGSGDLWISFNRMGEWLQPANLGEPINSKYNEMCPYVTTDDKLFIFSSGRFSQNYYEAELQDLSEISDKLQTWDNGQQNIYTISAEFIEEMRNQVLEEN
ncbi:MAG: hypothetical protein OEQ53_03985 [Saprospiraceae bacterium]|nr:hypothetical protein [Saprospiraceae bacterium]